jgi:predicted RNase H-like nuclease (RuvC/YqgF family)
MLKKVLLGLTVVLVVAYATESGQSYKEIDVQTENYILKLKLEIYELKSKNSELREIIEKMELKGESLKEMEPERAKAISKLRSDLRHRKNM